MIKATIKDLPVEVTLIILEDEDISIEDIKNFNSTCKKLWCITDYNTLWRTKYAQRWPSAAAFYKDTMGVEFYHANVEDVKEGIKCVKEVQRYASRMPEIYFDCDDDYIVKSIQEDFDELFISPEKYPMNLFILFDEFIRKIYKEDARQANLTERYYNIQILHYLNQYIFHLRWELLIINKQQHLEDIILMILQWQYPDKYITHTDLDNFINNIVQKVLKFLKDENSQHPIFSISRKQLLIWKYNNINKNYWNEDTAMPIKRALDKMIVNFDSNKLWMGLNQIDTNCMLQTIQRKYHKHVSSLTIYTCVARRLGLYFKIVAHLPRNFSQNIHLAWTSRNCAENTECFTFDWIDNQNSIKISDIKECQLMETSYVITSDSLSTELISEATKMETENLRHSCALPFVYNSLAQLNGSIRYRMAKHSLPDQEFCEMRSPNLKYTIGLVVRHKHNLTDDGTYEDIAGVIIGWHNKCNIKRFLHSCTNYSSNDIEEYTLIENNIDDMTSQPCYILLIDNEMCYVPQDTITSVCTSEWINSTEIGRYFCKFVNTHYVPNKMLERHYPNDAAVREIFIKNNL